MVIYVPCASTTQSVYASKLELVNYLFGHVEVVKTHELSSFAIHGVSKRQSDHVYQETGYGMMVGVYKSSRIQDFPRKSSFK